MAGDRKTAIVTGASQGIGAALVKAYRENGFNVVANSRSIEPSADDNVLAVPGDIGDKETAERVVAKCLGRFGRVDTLINNAGIFISKPFTAYSAADFSAIINVNLGGFFYISQLAIADMERRRSGHVVQITSTLVEHAVSDIPAVLANVTKGGLTAATRSLAIEYAKRGIRANAVSLGTIKTPMHNPDSYAALDALHPIGHMGDVADVVGAILYLETAKFVTGEILHVDGGQSAGH